MSSVHTAYVTCLAWSQSPDWPLMLLLQRAFNLGCGGGLHFSSRFYSLVMWVSAFKCCLSFFMQYTKCTDPKHLNSVCVYIRFRINILIQLTGLRDKCVCFLSSCQFWQLYNAVTLFKLSARDGCKEWQVKRMAEVVKHHYYCLKTQESIFCTLLILYCY